MERMRKSVFRDFGARVSVCSYLTVAAIAATADNLPPINTSAEAVTAVFHAKIMRPLTSSFESLRRYFSSRQQKNIDEFLRASADLIDKRNSLARRLGIQQRSWWPTGVDSFQVTTVLSADRDLLTGRTEVPDEIKISSPKIVDRKALIQVTEKFKEHGQDRYLGSGVKTSSVTLVSEHGVWVIDDIVFTTSHPEGATDSKTLTQVIRDSTEVIRTAADTIARLPKNAEIRKPTRSGD